MVIELKDEYDNQLNHRDEFHHVLELHVQQLMLLEYFKNFRIKKYPKELTDHLFDVAVNKVFDRGYLDFLKFHHQE